MRPAGWLCQLAGLVLLGMPGTTAAGWRGEMSGSQPGSFPLPPPVEVHYEFGWEKFPAAKAVVFLNGKSGLVQGRGKGETVGPVRPLWPYRCEVTAKVRKKTLTSVSFRNDEWIRGKRRDTRLSFQPERVTIQRVTKEAGDTGEKVQNKWFAVPARGLLAAALWFRSQALVEGHVYQRVVVPGWSPYLVTIRVAGREAVWLGRQEKRHARKAIRLEVNLQKIERNDRLTEFDKFKKATLWLSDDALRLPLRIEAEIMVGKVYAEQTLLQRR